LPTSRVTASKRSNQRKEAKSSSHCGLNVHYPWKIECFLEDLFLGGQSSIILGYRRLSLFSLFLLAGDMFKRVLVTASLLPGKGSDRTFLTCARVLSRDYRRLDSWTLGGLLAF